MGGSEEFEIAAKMRKRHKIDLFANLVFFCGQLF